MAPIRVIMIPRLKPSRLPPVSSLNQSAPPPWRVRPHPLKAPDASSETECSTTQNMAPKRKRVSKSELEAENKRLREFAEKTAEELMCAISYDLPVDPVTAEDGIVYERALITKWIKEVEAEEKPLKSPKLNTPMGPRLFPATQVRNTIQEMVRSGAVSGPKADAWAKRIADGELVKKTRALAEGGNGDAMYNMGCYYHKGTRGLAIDFKQAVGWWQRGHDAGNVRCTANLAFCYEKGVGVEKNSAYSMHLYSIAAAHGS